MTQIKPRFLILLILVSSLILCSSFSSRASEPYEEIAGIIESVQGRVLLKRANKTVWKILKLNDIVRIGDTIKTNKNSRAVCVLRNDACLNIDQATECTIGQEKEDQPLLIRIVHGIINFFSSRPRSIGFGTAFVNGSVEGTEFCVKVEQNQTLITVFRGKILAANKAGSLILTSGQSAIAQAAKAPELRIVIHPRDAVNWALYYPAIFDYRPTDFQGTEGSNWREMVRKSIEFYRAGDLSRALTVLDKAPEDIQDPRFFTYRAGLLLAVGSVAKANNDIRTALKLDPSNSNAYALQSIIAMVQNRKDKSMELAKKAVSLDPKSPAARVALSYSQQAHFNLEGALKSLKEAVKLDPENALALARLSEIWLSLGYLDKALETAQKAVALNPNLSRTQTVLGFTYLTQIKIKESKSAFEKAIELDSASPLPRLGLGLAKIRDGELKEGGKEIEIAAALDPNNSLIRSYLGKAYFEEKRGPLDEEQYKIAEELDPRDPTPWFYDAIAKQTTNRPVEALHDLQKSIELNDNRAVYRSRLMLDQDLAARSASLARIYSDLGFQQLALVEGWKSVNTDPSNFSAHRFLADSYAALPRHEIARVSELLQSQLLQPINVNPIQPSLAESNVFILDQAGPANPSFNEFNPLFNRNHFTLQASGVAGGKNTLGEEVIHSGLWNRMSYSLGQIYYKTNGFREDNDEELKIYDLFAQMSLTHKTNVQAEYRSRDIERGDLSLLFDPNNFLASLREKENTKYMRVGLRHAFGPNSDLIVSLSHLEQDFNYDWVPGYTTMVDADGYMSEVQHLFRAERFNITSGIGYLSSNRKDADISSPSSTFTNEFDTRHTNLYVYTLINYPKNVNWTLGGSVDFFKNSYYDIKSNQVNPKFGLTWNPFPDTTLRAAVFRTFKRTLLSNQTLEPTQVAGFIQFFDDGDAADSWRYGIGFDQKLFTNLFGGAEFSKRDLEEITIAPPVSVTQKFASTEYLSRVYMYWTPNSQLALTAEYQFERFKNPLDFPKDELISRLNTNRFSFGINFFHPCGFSARLKPTYIIQNGEFAVHFAGPPPPMFVSSPGNDRFLVVDGSIGYRLPKRRGLITIEVKNLFGKTFRFQDTDPSNPGIYPDRMILGKFTIAF